MKTAYLYKFTQRLSVGFLVTLLVFSPLGSLSKSTPKATAATAPVMLKNINTQPHSSWAWGYTEFDGLVYFGACENNGNTCGLYATDGTEEGTRNVEVYDNEGAVHDWPNNMTIFSNALYFTSQDNNEYTRLWVLTSSSNNPEPVAAGNGEGEAFEDVSDLFVHGNILYFVGREWNGEDWYLWRTDGNSVPTKVPTPGLNDEIAHRGIDGFTSVGTELFFTIQTDGYAFDEGRQLWKVVNGADAELVADFKNDSLTIPSTIASIGNTPYILVYEDPDLDPTEPGFRLYEIEDTGVGTSTLNLIDRVSDQSCEWDDYYDTYSLACPEHETDIWESPSMISTGADLFILARNGNTFKPVWFSGDTEQISFAPGEENWTGVDAGWIIHHTDQTEQIYYFSETNGEETFHILNYGGTSVTDISLADYHNIQIWDYAFFNNKIHIFMCKDDVGCGIWRVNDSNTGFVSLSILNENFEEMTDGYSLRPVGNDLYFTAEESEHGAEPWIYTTMGGSRLIKDIDTGSSGSIPNEFSRFITTGNTTFFFAQTEESVLELWKTDGTENGTVRVAPTEDWDGPGPMYAFNNQVYFYAYDHDNGTYPLMVSDGSSIDYAVDADFGPTYFQPIIFNDRLYFGADDGESGYEPWSIDTNGNAEKLIDINNSGSSSPFGFSVVGSTLYFFTDYLGVSLWKTDGTEEGTVMISNEVPYIHTQINYPAVNNSLIFWDYDNHLYRVHNDVIEQIEAADDSEFNFRYDTNPVVLSDQLFFSAYTDDLGTELWKTDGTKEGTMVVEDFSLGGNSTYPERLTVFDNHIWFNYDTEELLFYSDGNTVTLIDDAPYCTNRFTVVGNTMYFTGYETFDECDEGEESRKLYSISSAGEPIVEITGNFKEPTSLSTAHYQNEETARLYFWAENENGYEPWTIGDIENEAGEGGNNGGGGNGNNNGGSSGGSSTSGSYGSRAAVALASVIPSANVVALVAQLHSLISQFIAQGGELSPLMKAFLDLYPNTTTSIPVRDLEYGSQGEDVRTLQTILIGQGYSIPAGATGWFGEQTRSALRAYQASSAINPALGYFGPVTRAFMKASGIAGLWW